LQAFAAVAQVEYRLRVTVDLVQVAATVTDSRGNPVPTRRPPLSKELKTTTFAPLRQRIGESDVTRREQLF
jgi:hypothetical protein